MLRTNIYKPIYRTHRESIEKDFYIPCFSASKKLCRAVGFFSLHSLALSINGLIKFIRNNGEILLICSPELSQTDAELIDTCINLDKEYITKTLIESIIESKLSEEELYQLDIICNMISDGYLKIKIAYRPVGLFHEKFGIFIDEFQNMVYFNGSLNETKYALVYNQESIRVNCSWTSYNDKNFIEDELKYFNNLWDNNEESITVIDFPEAVKAEILKKYKRSETLNKAIENYTMRNITNTEKRLYSYQEDAIQQFCDNEYEHFYEMATGTGKTYTSVKTIQRLKQECNEKKFIIICVPQIDLQNQWKAALEDEGFTKIFLFGGNGTNYDRTLDEAIISFCISDDDIICISTFDTFFTKMHTRICDIKPLFIIVDEAHNLTSAQLNILGILNPQYKLGLSATIQRFDENESKAITKFFSPDQTFYYGIEDAINNGFLSEYEYHPITVNLTEDENNSFMQKSKLLAQEYSKEKPDKDKIDTLSRDRSLILKQASNKLTKLYELINNGYNFTNSVVYCGQGKEAGGDSIIDAVTKILHEGNLVVSQFTSNTPDRKRVLSEFEQGFYDTLVAIRCFDEGVDVPKLDKIYIMASDSALRQTVQRRGRVLRKCKEKGEKVAHIYDMIVLPAIEAGKYGNENLFKIELPRALEYNRLASNKEENDAFIRNLAKEYNVSLDNIFDYEK